MRLSSLQFSNEGEIPVQFTCDGQNINPPLKIEDIPPATKSMVLIMSDIDGRYGYWVHWLVYNIPVMDTIEQNSTPGTAGKNDFNEYRYHGPDLEKGTHQYLWEIYALDTEIVLNDEKNIEELEEVMNDHIIDNAELIGVYSHA